MKLNSDLPFRCVSVSDPRFVRFSIPPLNQFAMATHWTLMTRWRAFPPDMTDPLFLSTALMLVVGSKQREWHDRA